MDYSWSETHFNYRVGCVKKYDCLFDDITKSFQLQIFRPGCETKGACRVCKDQVLPFGNFLLGLRDSEFDLLGLGPSGLWWIDKNEEGKNALLC